MRAKTSLTLDHHTIVIARSGAQHAGKSLSQWVEQAILNEAARNDVDLMEAWERSLPTEDRAVLDAFAEADRAANLGAA